MYQVQLSFSLQPQHASSETTDRRDRGQPDHQACLRLKGVQGWGGGGEAVLSSRRDQEREEGRIPKEEGRKIEPPTLLPFLCKLIAVQISHKLPRFEHL